jgi:hypothetical protein
VATSPWSFMGTGASVQPWPWCRIDALAVPARETDTRRHAIQASVGIGEGKGKGWRSVSRA